MLYSTYLGGSTHLSGFNAIEVDAQGKIYVGGGARATNYPTTAGAFDTGFNGSTDVIFSIIDPASGGASDLVYSTYMGTNGEDQNGILDIVLDAAGDVYLVGQTGCGTQVFPNGAPIPSTAIDPDCLNSGANTEGFAVKLSPDGNGTSDLLWATYLGGDGNKFESANNAELDADGNLVVVGAANGPNFPTTPGAFDPVGDPSTGNVTEDVFVVKITPDGSTLLFGTYISGGTPRDMATDVAIDDDGNIYIAGATSSTGMPTVAPYQATLSGVSDAWLGKLSADGSTLLFSTYFGCTGFEFALALELDASGVPVIAGSTSSTTDFPATPGAYQTTVLGSRDSFITKLDPDLPGTHICGDSVPPPPVTNQDPDCSGAAIADQSADANCQATISGSDVTGVTDPDSDPLTITVDPTNLALGSNTVTVEADDGNGGMCSIDINVNVVDDTPPVITAEFVPFSDDDSGSDDDSSDDNKCRGKFIVNFSASDNCNDVTVSAELNGIPVDDGTVVKLKVHDKIKTKTKKDGTLDLKAPSFSLVVTATDAAGNVSTANIDPFEGQICDDDKSDDKSSDDDSSD